MLRAKFGTTDLYGVCAQSVRNGIVSFQCENVSVQWSHGFSRLSNLPLLDTRGDGARPGVSSGVLTR